MNKKLIQEFESKLKLVAKENGVEPKDVTKAMYHCSKNQLNSAKIAQAGGFNKLKAFLFPDSVDVVLESAMKNTRSYRNQLSKEFGNAEYQRKQFLHNLDKVIGGMKFNLHKPVTQKPKLGSIKRTIVAHLSDTHYGANISAAEVGNLNNFNWQVAGRRTALFFEQLANYKAQYRKDTDLVLLINGDIISGVIHDQEWFVDMLTTQFAGTLHILSEGISYLANHFPKVTVHCTAGNHGRSMHKASKDRATTHKWDNYEHMVYIALKKAIEPRFANVTINVPQTPYALFEVQGHKMFSTHGDTVINVGNPGKSLHMGSIANQINKLNAGLGKTIKDEVKAVIVGHVHVPTVQIMDNGVNLIINGCLSGLDPYANAIGIFDSHPTQQMFESTAEHVVGDIRFIRLKDADNKKELDKIISPFNKPY